jgi:hypothetical protein
VAVEFGERRDAREMGMEQSFVDQPLHRRALGESP